MINPPDVSGEPGQAPRDSARLGGSDPLRLLEALASWHGFCLRAMPCMEDAHAGRPAAGTRKA
jgi:hypothetical protein